MPRSKRAKVITLSKTVSKGRDGKSKLIENLQSYVEEYKTIYVFHVENMRTKIFQELRNNYRDTSKFYMGKKSLVRLAFGANEKDSYVKNLHKLVEAYEKVDSPEVGILFTNVKPSKIEKEIRAFSQSEFARGGFVPDEDFVREKGVLEGFPTSMFEHLRKLQLPVVIATGTIELLEDYQVCQKNVAITPEQGEFLKLLGVKLAKFTIELDSKFHNGNIRKV